MRALVVGADRVRPICAELEQTSPLGVTCTECWSGRQPGDARRPLPADTRVVVVLCDRVNHNLLFSVRRQAEGRGVPVVYCRHSLVDVRAKIARLVVADAERRERTGEVRRRA
ncbi:DUF2325 domain-containing protein [Pseudothauera rhizosphaerae]|nr:hypothetical protein [Pseudothauera rhizosphaerae]